MTYRVFLTTDALHDLEELYDHVASHDAAGKAEKLVDRIEKTFSTLSDNPHRGTYPKELLAIGLREFREVFFASYRIIYRVVAEDVYVMIVADGRRDMRALLERRLLRF